MNSSFITLPTGSNIGLLPVHHAAKPKKETQLKSGALLALSIINIIIWAVSTFLGVTIIVTFNAGLFDFYRASIDLGGWGIWCSWFYVIAGFTGYSASYKKKKSLIVTTLVFAIFSLITSLTVAVISGVMGGETSRRSSYLCSKYDYINGNYVNWYQECDAWSGLEFTLMSFSIIAFFINLAVTVITSMALCSCCGKKTTSGAATMQQVLPNTYNNQQLVTMPMYASPLSPTGVQPAFIGTMPYTGQLQQQPQSQVLLATSGQQSLLYPVQQVQQQNTNTAPRSQMSLLSGTEKK